MQKDVYNLFINTNMTLKKNAKKTLKEQTLPALLLETILTSLKLSEKNEGIWPQIMLRVTTRDPLLHLQHQAVQLLPIITERRIHHFTKASSVPQVGPCCLA